MASKPVVVNLTRGRLGVYLDGLLLWVGTQDQWSTARAFILSREQVAS